MEYCGVLLNRFALPLVFHIADFPVWGFDSLEMHVHRVPRAPPPNTSMSKKINSGTKGKADRDLEEFAKCLSWLTLVSDKLLASFAKESLPSRLFPRSSERS